VPTVPQFPLQAASGKLASSKDGPDADARRLVRPQIGSKDREAWARVELDEALGTEALLLGRRSYEYFAVR
jgi:hypothetical protein